MSLLIDLTKTVKGKDISKVSDQVRNQRLSICHECPYMNLSTKSCGGFLTGGTVNYNGEQKELCGCYLPDKTKYADDGCPLGKW